MFHYNLVNIIASIPGAIIAFTMYNYIQAKVAMALGDPTPHQYGFDTLEPRRHFDIVGFIMLLLIQVGWSKPVPINRHNFASMKRDSILLVLLTSLALIIVGFILFMIMQLIALIWMHPTLNMVLGNAVLMMVGMAIFTMIPIPPLPGFYAIQLLLPEAIQEWIQSYQLFFVIAMLVLINIGIFSGIIYPIMIYIMKLYYGLASILLG